MAENRGDRRAETARQNDDSDLIERDQEEASVQRSEQQGREGGNLQRDVGTQAEELRATDPDATESITKGDHIAHGDDEPRSLTEESETPPGA